MYKNKILAQSDECRKYTLEHVFDKVWFLFTHFEFRVFDILRLNHYVVKRQMAEGYIDRMLRA